MRRSCVRCRRPLSAYNDGELCGACEVAGRDDPGEPGIDLPVTFWFRPDLRDALGRWDWGAVLAAVCARTGAAQTYLADAVGVSQAQISRLINGRSTNPGIRTVLRIVDALGIPRLLAGFAPRGLGLSIPGDGVSVEPVKRRTFGKAAIGITLAIPLAGTEAGERLDVTRMRPNDAVADLYALDDRFGGAAVADLARRRLLSLTRQVDRAVLAPSAETRVQSVIGELATCCAWFYFDSGDPRRARVLDSDALCAAHLANDTDLQIEVLASMSMRSRRDNKPGEALNLAESALSAARGADPRIKALLSMRIALAEAKRQDKAAFNKYRRRAWADLERASGDERPAWFQFFDEREMAAMEALGLMDLGHNAEAARIFGDAVDKEHTFMRNKAVRSAARAQALIASGEPDQAADVITKTLPVLTEVTSARLVERLAAVRTALEPYRSAPDIADCREILTGLCHDDVHAAQA